MDILDDGADELKKIEGTDGKDKDAKDAKPAAKKKADDDEDDIDEDDLSEETKKALRELEERDRKEAPKKPAGFGGLRKAGAASDSKPESARGTPAADDGIDPNLPEWQRKSLMRQRAAQQAAGGGDAAAAPASPGGAAPAAAAAPASGTPAPMAAQTPKGSAKPAQSTTPRGFSGVPAAAAAGDGGAPKPAWMTKLKGSAAPAGAPAAGGAAETKLLAPWQQRRQQADGTQPAPVNAVAASSDPASQGVMSSRSVDNRASAAGSMPLLAITPAPTYVYQRSAAPPPAVRRVGPVDLEEEIADLMTLVTTRQEARALVQQAKQHITNANRALELVEKDTTTIEPHVCDPNDFNNSIDRLEHGFGTLVMQGHVKTKKDKGEIKAFLSGNTPSKPMSDAARQDKTRRG